MQVSYVHIEGKFKMAAVKVGHKYTPFFFFRNE